MTESCRAFDAWLDQGMPGPADAARAHATTCGRCARALGAALALERALAEEAVRSPRGFTDAVMARIALRSLAAAGMAFAPSSLAWWLRAPAQPATALALVLAAVVLAGRETIAAWAVAGQVAMAEALAHGVPARLLEPIGAGLVFHDPLVRFGVALGLAPVVVLASLALYAWASRSLATPALRPR